MVAIVISCLADVLQRIWDNNTLVRKNVNALPEKTESLNCPNREIGKNEGVIFEICLDRVIQNRLLYKKALIVLHLLQTKAWTITAISNV